MSKSLKEFAQEYAERSGERPCSMYSKQTIEDAMPAILDLEVRDDWYMSGDLRLMGLAEAASTVAGLYAYEEGKT